MIYVLGGAGFVGSAYVRMLEAAGAPVRAVTRANYAALRGTACAVLVNAAGSSSKPLAARDPLADFDAAVRGVAASLESFRADRYVLLSTGDVYAETRAPEATREDGPPPDPARLGPYGRHRLLAEQVVRGAHPDWLVVRMGGFVGPGLRKNAVFDILTGAPVWLAPDSALQFLHTDDAARLVWAVLSGGATREAVNLGAEGLLTLGEFHRAVGSASAFRPDAPTLRHELSLDRLRALTADGGPLPRTRDCVARFAADLRAGRAWLGATRTAAPAAAAA